MRGKSSNTLKVIAFMLSLLLCASMLLCSISVYAEAGASEQANVTEQNEEAIKNTEEQNDDATTEGSVDSAQTAEADAESGETSSLKKGDSTSGDPLSSEKKNSKLLKAPALRAEQNNVITSVEALLQDGSGLVGDTITQWQVFRIKALFDLPDDTVKNNDTTTIKLPEKLRFDQTMPFDVTTPAGDVVAHAVVNGANKTLTLTYTDYPEKNSNVSGNFFFYVRMDRSLVDGEEDISLDFVINNQVISAGTVHFDGYPTPQGGIVGKSGTQESTVEGSRAWFGVNINTKGENLKDVTVIDTLKTEGISIDKDSFKILKGRWEAIKGDFVFQDRVEVTDQYTVNWNPDGSGFSVDIGDIAADEGYRITYYIDSDYELVDGERVDNNIVLHADGIKEQKWDARIVWAIAGGSAEGYVYKIKIKKVEKGDDQNVLAGAEFEVKRTANGVVVGTITTDASGEAEIGGLLRDAYELREITSPPGYKALSDPITISADDFSSDRTALITVENERDTTSVSVEKRWIGKAADSATVNLLRKYGSDGAETVEATGMSRVLNAANQWKVTFEDLDKYAPDGSEYKYYVEEKPLSGYSTEVSETGDNSFVVTNTNVETIDIPVKKMWVGEPVEGAKIVLKADGVVKTEAAVGAEDGWTYTFTDLPVYDKEDGHAIEYDVQESSIEGYISGRSGTAEDGFTFTNTITGKVSVPVTKAWEGPKMDSVTIDLLADGKRVSSVVLNEENSWQHTFTDLEKYDNGKEIEYTVSEPQAENYKTEIQGNAQDGFTVTNTNTETKTVDVTKKWVGSPTQQIFVRLYADGVEVDNAIISEADGWQHSFANLPVYTKSGERITYDISEDQLDGYETEISGSTDEGYTITNTKEEEPAPPEKEPPADNKTPSDKESSSPKTGDETNLAAYILLMLLSLAALTAVARKAKR